MLSTRGDVAATLGDRLVLRTAAGRRQVRRSAVIRRLALEDDRTVVWQSASGLHVVDLPAPVTPGTCPARAGYAAVARTAQVVVTQREYVDGDGHYGTVVRGCTLTTGDDAPLRVAHNWLDGGESLTAVGADRDLVVMVSDSTNDKYDSSCSAMIVIRDAAGGAASYRQIPCGDDPRPDRGEPLAVTGNRSVAWVEGRRLLAYGGTGLVTLDEGAVTNLRATGARTVAWTRDGVDRGAAL